ncbi:MAG: hypothetical protein AAF770_01350 [Bacteroidota bacterium]
MKKYYLTLFFLINALTSERLLANKWSDQLPHFFDYHTPRQEKVLSLQAIERDIRNVLIYYLLFSFIVMFQNMDKIASLSPLFRVLFLSGPFVSNISAGMIQRLLAKYPAIQKSSRFVQNFLFTLLGTLWVTGLVVFMVDDDDPSKNIKQAFISNSIMYALTSIVIYLLQLNSSADRVRS